MSQYNPFRAKAEKLRAAADRANAPTAHERGMAQSFPLGAGYGRPNGGKRIEASVNRAVEAVRLSREAAWMESKADSFDAGRCNAQGRSINPESIARSIKREAAQERRAARVAAAKAILGDQPKWAVSAEVWADANDIMGGAVRAFVIAEHAESVAKAITEGLLQPEPAQ